jgi:hypothetical protein
VPLSRGSRARSGHLCDAKRKPEAATILRDIGRCVRAKAAVGGRRFLAVSP